MFKKFNNWFKVKLMRWLKIEDLLVTTKKQADRISKLERQVADQEKRIQEHTKDLNDLFFRTKAVDDFSKLLDGAVDLGMRDQHKNWAVFATQGKGQDYVKFVDLSNLDYREVKDWIHRLESIGITRERFRYDAPLGVKDSFLYSDRY